MTIASQHIPSMCAVSPLPSDDDISAQNVADESRTVSPHSAKERQLDSKIVLDSLPGQQLEAAATAVASSSSSSSRSSKESEQLVSITPDIVKPVKEVKNGGGEEDGVLLPLDDATESTAVASATGDKSPGLLKSGSSGRLPDMLSHTPDGQVGSGGGRAAPLVVLPLALGETDPTVQPTSQGNYCYKLQISCNTIHSKDCCISLQGLYLKYKRNAWTRCVHTDMLLPLAIRSNPVRPNSLPLAEPATHFQQWEFCITFRYVFQGCPIIDDKAGVRFFLTCC